MNDLFEAGLAVALLRTCARPRSTEETTACPPWEHLVCRLVRPDEEALPQRRPRQDRDVVGDAERKHFRLNPPPEQVVADLRNRALESRHEPAKPRWLLLNTNTHATRTNRGRYKTRNFRTPSQPRAPQSSGEKWMRRAPDC